MLVKPFKIYNLHLKLCVLVFLILNIKTCFSNKAFKNVLFIVADDLGML